MSGSGAAAVLSARQRRDFGLLCLAAICGAGGFKVRGFSGFLVGVGSEIVRRISPVRPRIASASSTRLLVFLGVGGVAFFLLGIAIDFECFEKIGGHWGQHFYNFS